MNTDNGKPTRRKSKKLRDSEKMKIDQGISEIDKVEMGRDGAKENSHKVESLGGNEEKRGKKRKNRKRKREQTTDTNEEMTPDKKKIKSRRLKKARKFFQRSKRLRKEEELRMLELGIPEIDKLVMEQVSAERVSFIMDQRIAEIELEMAQEGTKGNSHIVESKRKNEKKRGKKRKNQNREKEEGKNKNSGGVQKGNGEKGAEAKGMEGEINAKEQITYTNNEINNSMETDTGNGKPTSNGMKRTLEFFQRGKERELAQKMKKDQGISEMDKLEMGQESAKENLHVVESKRENEKKRGKKRKNQNREKEGGSNKSSGEGQKVNGVKGAESKGMKGEAIAKNKQTTYTNKEINKRRSE